MNTQKTILQLEGLKLKSMVEYYKALQTMPVNEWPTVDQFIAKLAKAENQYRNHRHTELNLNGLQPLNNILYRQFLYRVLGAVAFQNGKSSL